MAAGCAGSVTGRPARQTGTVNQHISHGLRTILASISDPNRHGGLTYYMSQHMRPAAHHHRNNRSGGQCHDFVQHFILVPRQTDVGQIHAFTAGGTVFGYGLCRTIVVEFTVIAAFAGAAAYEYHAAALAHRSADTSLGLAAKQTRSFPRRATNCR